MEQIKKTRGKIYIKGNEITIRNPRDAIKKGLFCVPEDRKKDGLCIKMSVKDNITLPNLDMVTSLGVLKNHVETKMTNEAITRLSIKTPSKDQLVKKI